MHKYVKQHSLKAGLPPGSLVHIGVRKRDNIQITQLNYSEDSFEEKEIDLTEVCLIKREVIGSFEREESPLIKESTDIYVRDLYDHVIQIMDTTETLRDILSSMLDIYLSSISNRMNEIMKVLTIISTVFIPLSFIVGLYGMNLKNIPEYEWPGMYPTVWVIMISIAAFMLAYFKKKKWW
jgi:magnesium/cobalt transport protein CorA